MNVRHVRKWCMVAALAALGANFGLHKAIAAQPGQAGVEEGVQVLTRGPGHEAFAEIGGHRGRTNPITCGKSSAQPVFARRPTADDGC